MTLETSRDELKSQGEIGQVRDDRYKRGRPCRRSSIESQAKAKPDLMKQSLAFRRLCMPIDSHPMAAAPQRHSNRVKNTSDFRRTAPRKFILRSLSRSLNLCPPPPPPTASPSSISLPPAAPSPSEARNYLPIYLSLSRYLLRLLSFLPNPRPHSLARSLPLHTHFVLRVTIQIH
jgi:hypothetical protein